MNQQFSLADFDRWIAQMTAAGFVPTKPNEVERIRTLLKAGATMSVPVKTYPI